MGTAEIIVLIMLTVWSVLMIIAGLGDYDNREYGDNPYKYVDKENIYPRLDGVLHQGGYKVATNGCILIRYKCDYPQQ